MISDSGVEGIKGSGDGLSAEIEELKARLQDAERRYEEERARNESLLYEQSRFQALIESMADEVWICDADGELTWVNSAAIEGIGFESKDEVYRPLETVLSSLEILETDGTPRSTELSPLLRSALYGEVIRQKDELVRHLKSGEIRYRRISSAPIFDFDGTILGAVAIVRDISEHVHTQQALAASEARFRATFEHAAAGIAHISPDGGFISANARYCEITGYSVDEMRMLTFQSITHPDDLIIDLSNTEKLLSGEVSSYSIEKRYLRKDGSIVWVNLTSSLMRDREGRPEFLIAVVEDISSWKRIESELSRAKEIAEQRAEELDTERATLAAVIDNAPEGIIVTDSEARILIANPVAEQLYGRPIPYGLDYPSHRFLRIRYADGTPCEPRNLPLCRAALDGVTMSGEEYSVDRPDGTVINILVSCAPVYDRQGRSCGAVSIFQDISSMVETRKILHRRYQEYRALVENNSDIISRFDRDYRFIFVNPAVMKSTGYLPEFFIGRTLDEIGLSDCGQTDMSDALREVFTGGEEVSREIYFDTADGEKVYLIRFSPELSHEGDVSSVLGIWREITGFKQLEHQLISAKNTAEAANRAKSDFLAHMSHEIRTPIGGIIGLTDLLLSRTVDPDKLRFIGLIRESAGSLLDIINDILDLSKIESGKMEIYPQDFDLSQELARLEGTFSLIARNKGLSFSERITGDVPAVVSGDPKLLRQILTNLLSNAVKYTEKGGVTLSVSRESPERRFRLFHGPRYRHRYSL